MIVSNEPGYYVEGQYGIRLENLYVVENHSKEGYLKFRSLSLAPIDAKNIDISMMTNLEINWLKSYHEEVYKKISPYLQNKENQWLSDFMKIES